MSISDRVSSARPVATRGRIEELLFSSGRVATSMHWSDTADWLREHPQWTRALWRNGQLVGLLACTVPLAGNSWLRICALQDGVDARASFRELWLQLRAALQGEGVIQVNLLCGQQDWLRDCLPDSGFRRSEEVISLSRAFTLSAPPGKDLAHIRPASDSDLEGLRELDAAAFAPRWHMSDGELRRNLRRAACFTVAVADGRIHGFQVTTRGAFDVHLARLAVAPQHQGAGLGRQLLADVIRRLDSRRLDSLTVNTQADNYRSLRLYRRFGFQRNGDDFTVWSQPLGQAGEPS